MKRSIVGIIFLVLCCIAIVGNGYAASYGGHEYQLTSQTTWLSAEAEAVAAGGHLVTINDSAEEAWLQSQFGTSSMWIGFTDQAAEGIWAWISGESATYTNWSGGEPNNYYGNEDFAVMNWVGIKWNDLTGADNIVGIIEIANGGPGPVPTPEPATMLLLGLGLLGVLGIRRKMQK